MYKGLQMTEWLYPLLFVINHNLIFKTKHSFATKTGALLPFCNRAGNNATIDTADIEKIKDFFQDLPFKWFVDATDSHSIKLLEQHGFSCKIAFPAMHMKLSTLPKANDDIEIKKITDSADLATWINIVKKSYGIESEEFNYFIEYQKNHAEPDALQFYLAFYQGTPAAASMTIKAEKTVALHWVGTLPEMRKKGLGYAVSHKALLNAKKEGRIDAVLFASELGKPIYERIGFKKYASYNTYGL